MSENRPTFQIVGYRLRCPWPGCEHEFDSIMPASAWERCPQCDLPVDTQPLVDVTPPSAPAVRPGDTPVLDMQDDDIPLDVRRELMACAVSNGRISYRWLCDVYRKGRSEATPGRLPALRALRDRIRAWREDDKAGYDAALELLCDADDAITELLSSPPGAK